LEDGALTSTADIADFGGSDASRSGDQPREFYSRGFSFFCSDKNHAEGFDPVRFMCRIGSGAAVVNQYPSNRSEQLRQQSEHLLRDLDALKKMSNELAEQSRELRGRLERLAKKIADRRESNV